MSIRRGILYKVFGITLLLSYPTCALMIQIITRNKISGSSISGRDLLDFLATPANWPKIVATSNRVHSSDSILAPMKEGTSPVVEFLGIAGIDLISVEWICEVSEPGRVLVRSIDGIRGISENCTLQFDVYETNVIFTVQYDAVSVIGLLAAPVLKVDNWLTLNVFLPTEVS